MAKYAAANGGIQNNACALNLRHELKIAAFAVPASGRCLLAEIAYVVMPFWVWEPPVQNRQPIIT